MQPEYQPMPTDMPTLLVNVRQAFSEAGLVVSDWADAHGFRRESVYAVLSGRSKGRRGEAHRIAVALGLKASQPKAPLLASLPQNDRTRMPKRPSSDLDHANKMEDRPMS